MEYEKFFNSLPDYKKADIMEKEILEKLENLTNEGMLKMLDFSNTLKPDIEYNTDI